MNEVKKHIQNWEDIRIADIPKLYAIVSKRLIKGYNILWECGM